MGVLFLIIVMIVLAVTGWGRSLSYFLQDIGLHPLLAQLVWWGIVFVAAMALAVIYIITSRN